MRVTVRSSPGCASAPAPARASSSSPTAHACRRVAALGLGDEPAGCSTPSTRLRRRRHRARRGDEVALIPPVSGGDFRLTERAALARRRRPRGRARRGRRDRHLHRHVRNRSRGRDVSTSSTRPTRAWPSRRWRRSRPSCARYDLTAIAIHHRVGRRRDRRAERRDRRLRAAPRGRARRVPGGDRHAQGDGAAVEEGGLRGRRGVDRPGLVTYDLATRPG